MTQQEIEAFALQYHGIECVRMENGKIYKPLEALVMCEWYGIYFHEELVKIELRSIESLNKQEKKILMDESDLGCNKDYCRKIGVAVQFRDHSVEEMIDQGILKLKS